MEALEELVGKDRVDTDRPQRAAPRTWLNIALGQPIDLFPWLLLAVLALFVMEGMAANRFYRRPEDVMAIASFP